MSALCAFEIARLKTTWIREIRNIWWQLQDNGKQIEVIWVPSYCELYGNEKSDQTAYEERRNNLRKHYQYVRILNIRSTSISNLQ